MRSSTTVLALAALSIGDVLAGPTHAHLHRNAHEKKGLEKKDYDTSNVNWNNIKWKEIGVDWDKVNYGGASSSVVASSDAAAAPTSSAAPTVSAQAAVVTSAAPVSSSAAPSTVAVSSSSSSESSASSSSSQSASSGSKDEFTGLFEDLWHNLEGCANTNTAFGSQTSSTGDYVSYISNVGTPYGSNFMVVDSVGDQTYTMTFENTASEAMTVNCWNKPGMDGQANSGATDAPKQTTLTFNLSVGQTAIIAVDENTVGSCCEAVDRFDMSGAFAQTWVEFKFKKNDSGFDVSKILNTGPDYKVSMCAVETDCCSTETTNNWITDAQTTGSGSCYIPADGAHLTIKMSGTA